MAGTRTQKRHSSTKSRLALADDRVLSAILQIRGQRAMLDTSLATLYGVETRVLVQAVKRNLARFPADFMFQLTPEELLHLKSQVVISSAHGGRRTRPYVFTEQGVAMLSSVLRSPRAVAVNIAVMRAFVRIRELVAGHAGLLRRLDDLEKRYDGQFRTVFEAIRALVAVENTPRRRIGFHADPEPVQSLALPARRPVSNRKR
jgi:ORF6N domain